MAFTIGVLMLLIRPYLVYQLTGGGNMDKDPVKSTLLQRLIKKKDEHIELHESATVETRAPKFSFSRPVKQLLSFHFRNLLSPTHFCQGVFTVATSTMLILKLVKHRHSLLSCFRI